MGAALKRDPQGWYKANKLNPAVVAWYGQRPSPQAEGRHDDDGGHGDMDHLAMDHAHGAADGQEETGHGHNEQAMQHAGGHDHMRSEEHTSELQSLMRHA